MSVNLLESEQREAVQKLRVLAVENDVVCMQAPSIWDADNQIDANLARDNCLGAIEGQEPCPILNICGQTAFTLNTKYGVWGGMTPRDRLRLKKTFSKN